MLYRLAEKSDIEEICHIIKDAVNEMDKRQIYQWDDLYPTREDFLNDINNRHLFVGIADGNIAVIYAVNKECDEEYRDGKWKHPDSDYRVVHRLCVAPTYQNRGIATQTLTHIEKTLRDSNVESIRLDVFDKNIFALSMYLKNGYEEVGYFTWRKGKLLLMEKFLR